MPWTWPASTSSATPAPSLATVEELRTRGWRISDAHVARGLHAPVRNTGFAGRWQTIATDPLTIVDVGHNEDGLRVVNAMLAQTPHEQLHIVLGAVNDKDIDRMLDQLPRRRRPITSARPISRGGWRPRS